MNLRGSLYLVNIFIIRETVSLAQRSYTTESQVSRTVEKLGTVISKKCAIYFLVCNRSKERELCEMCKQRNWTDKIAIQAY
jgi:hypothetical protein